MLNHKGEHVIESNMYFSLRTMGHAAGMWKNEVIRILRERILAVWSRFEEMSGRKRNSQADTYWIIENKHWNWFQFNAGG